MVASFALWIITSMRAGQGGFGEFAVDGAMRHDDAPIS